jgi:nitrogen fixation protein FixH
MKNRRLNTLLPPHIGWPLMVITLLLFSIGMCLTALYFAHSDGGAQVVEDYYHKAEHWDAHMQQQQANTQLGWQVSVSIKDSSLSEVGQWVTVQVLTSEGTPVSGLSGSLQAVQPHRSAPLSAVSLQANLDAPGTYLSLVPFHSAGLWDLDLTLLQDDKRFQTTIRKELSGLSRTAL